MQYVGRFVSSVYNTITPNINPATLSGAIDVIVVEREIEIEESEEGGEDPVDHAKTKTTGPGWASSEAASPRSSAASSLYGAGSSNHSLLNSLKDQSGRSSPSAASLIKKKRRKRKVTEMASTPFHVRFGKMSVLRPAERKVTLHLNSSPEPLPFAMKVGEAGEAFFVFEVDPETADKEGVPADLVTSPVLSATTSPVSAPVNSLDQQLPHRTNTADVEALDLGEAQTFSTAAGSTSSPSRSASRSSTTNPTTPEDSGSENGTARSPSPDHFRSQLSPDKGVDARMLKRNKASGPESTPGDLPVPDDSGPSGSGPNAGTGSLLDSVGDAASRAGGALSSVVKGSIGVSVSDKLSSSQQQSGSKLDTGSENPAEGKERLQEDDKKHPTSEGKGDRTRETELERLEREMRDHARELMAAERETRRLELHLSGRLSADEVEEANNNDSEENRETKSSSNEEEAYPAPFGASGQSTSEKTSHSVDHSQTGEVGTRPAAQAEHVDHLDGFRVGPTDTEDGSQLHAAQMDVRYIKAQLESKKQQYEALRKQIREDQATDSKGQEKPSQRNRSELNKLGASQIHDNLSYMFDMDGYKMTSDGEDLAFAEGQRFSNELPLSRRHGGKGRHGHSERLDRPHRHPRYLENGIEVTHASDDLATIQSGAAEHSRVHTLKHGSVDDDAISTTSSDSGDAASLDNKSESTPDLSTRQFTRDLVKLARFNESSIQRSSDRPTEAQLEEVVVSDEDALPEGVPRNRRASSSTSDRPRVYRPKRQGRSQSRGLGHLQEASLSDSETHAGPTKTRLPTTTGQHLRAKSGPIQGVFESFPGDATPTGGMTAADRAQSPEYDWSWGEMPKRRHSPVAKEPKKAATIDEGLGLPDSANHDEGGKLSHLPEDPYIFQLELSDTVYRFEMSLCWREGFGQNSSVDSYEFEESKLSYQRFMDEADIVNDVRLVLRYNDTLLTWENASTVMATLSLYRQSLLKRDSERNASSMRATQAESSSRWRRWWRRGNTTAEEPYSNGLRNPEAGPISRAQTDTGLELSQVVTETPASENGRAGAEPVKERPQKVYAKTLRLSSNQLKSLNLKKGANTITFSVTSSYSGVATCTARIFLWEASHQIVVSDIDGTITKSDALGHVFTMIGRDWTHQGVAKLYTDIARNGYRIMYLTSRAIGQADTTRDYLRGIKQNNYQLPDGPVIMSPDRLIASLHREVILRKPEVFKMACLRDIARLFGCDPKNASAPSPIEGDSTLAQRQQAGHMSNPTPFYAGFGNRITDALSYRSVNIPSSRIFTIDTNGEVKMELLEMAGYKSSYIHMSDLVDQMFPPITAREELNPKQREFNDFNFWRPPIEHVELPPDDELLPNPVSPALSARSGRSLRSVRSQGSVKSGGSVSERMEGSNSLPPSVSPSTSPPNAASSGRLSRFGLVSLGLGRRSSGNNVLTAEPASLEDRSASSRAASPPGSRDTSPPPPQAGSGAASPSSSYGNGTSTWTWRRRAASPGADPQASVPATSPLVGPVITADAASDDEENAGSDDDVSSLDGEDEDIDRLSEDEGPDEDNLGDDVLDDDDPLFAQGEIRFEWRG